MHLQNVTVCKLIQHLLILPVIKPAPRQMEPSKIYNPVDISVTLIKKVLEETVSMIEYRYISFDVGINVP